MKRILCGLFVVAGTVPAARADLKGYVAKPDATFRWTKRAEGEVNGVRIVELRLISQTWRGIEWKHRLFVARPRDPITTSQALMVISGSSWRDAYDEPPTGRPDFGNTDLLVRLANLARMPVAFLQHVPFQPMFGGKHEDEIIAYTFQQYMKTKESDWPLLLPMTKAAVRGMDAIQAFARDAWSFDIRNFTVTGGSKRGWTTWLTGAVDRRVNSIAPMVIDVLNMGPQMRHQLESWGQYSNQINDYTELGIQEQMSSPEGRALNRIVDPFVYRHDLTQPKLIMLGTNDPYWPVDALNLYWHQLVGEKHILYVPNKGHGLDDYRRVLGGAAAIALQAAGKLKLPDLDWDLLEHDDGLHLSVRSTPTPSRLRAWIAHSPTRDFRKAKWESFPIDLDAARIEHRLARPATGYAVMFGEAVYTIDGHEIFLSTTLQVIEALDGWTTLFNGRDLSGWNTGRSGTSHNWHTAGRVAIDLSDARRLTIDPGQGVMVNGATGRTRDLYTDESHGDCELHIEFMVAKGSNSGVYFQSRYEIQILDSFDKPKVGLHDCGGVYERWIDDKGVGGNAPAYNASKPPGTWQSFDVIFRAPRFDAAGHKTANARFEKVRHNGIVVHDDVELPGPTRGGQGGPERALAPLRLQGDHGPVAFRNIRIKKLDG